MNLPDIYAINSSAPAPRRPSKFDKGRTVEQKVNHNNYISKNPNFIVKKFELTPGYTSSIFLVKPTDSVVFVVEKGELVLFSNTFPEGYLKLKPGDSLELGNGNEVVLKYNTLQALGCTFLMVYNPTFIEEVQSLPSDTLDETLRKVDSSLQYENPKPPKKNRNPKAREIAMEQAKKIEQIENSSLLEVADDQTKESLELKPVKPRRATKLDK